MPDSDRFSDFVVYVDESGDHNLRVIDAAYPVFVLAFCIFYKKHYSEIVVPRLQQLKFEHFGHDLIILHEHDIRKERGDFNIFRSESEREGFLDQLTDIIEISNFVLASCVIRKSQIAPPEQADNPYHLALRACLESLYAFVLEKEQHELETHVVVECRGRKEDAALELEFRRICDGENRYKKNFPFNIRMADKGTNSAGLQLADLVARPIGRYVLDPSQSNRAFDILKKKLYCEGGRKAVGEGYEGFGLKLIP